MSPFFFRKGTVFRYAYFPARSNCSLRQKSEMRLLPQSKASSLQDVFNDIFVLPPTPVPRAANFLRGRNPTLFLPFRSPSISVSDRLLTRHLDESRPYCIFQKCFQQHPPSDGRGTVKSNPTLSPKIALLSVCSECYGMAFSCRKRGTTRWWK